LFQFVFYHKIISSQIYINLAKHIENLNGSKCYLRKAYLKVLTKIQY